MPQTSWPAVGWWAGVGLIVQASAVAAAAATTAVTAAAAAPTGLLCDFQRTPALGVGWHAPPLFGWIVPGCPGGSSTVQTAYRLEVRLEVTAELVWDSGRVVGNGSTRVPYDGPALLPAESYVWTVVTWGSGPNGSGGCVSPASAPARFVTALLHGWHPSAAFLWLPNTSNPLTQFGDTPPAVPPRFGYFRRVIDVSQAGGDGCIHSPRPHSTAQNRTTAVTRALLFASGSVDPTILSAVKVYIGGRLVAVGPGRGEAGVRNGDGQFRPVYMTLDVTGTVAAATRQGQPAVLAVEGQSPMGDDDWDTWDPRGRTGLAAPPPGVVLELQILRSDGTSCTVTSGDRGGWTGWNADAYYRPLGDTVTWYNQVVENTDARAEPLEWRSSVTAAANWRPAVTTNASTAALAPKMARPLQVFAVGPRPLAVVPPPPPPPPPPPLPTSQTSQPSSRRRPTHQQPLSQPGNATSVTCGVLPVVFGQPKSVIALSCPTPGEVVVRVDFASYGAPGGSCTTGFDANKSCDAPLSRLVAEVACLGLSSCSIQVGEQVVAKRFGPDPCPGVPKRVAIVVTCGLPVGPTLLADFGREFQGGVVLNASGVGGQRVRVTAGELQRPLHTPGEPEALVSNAWGGSFVFTLRDGPQSIAQHNYMLFRYVSLTFLDGPPPEDLRLGAWGVAYEWVEADTAFNSSNAVLNHVWTLCADTLRYGVVDTFTDANNRERRPYEADGLIAGGARTLVQRDVLWARHSYSWVLEFPTWPIEWQQQSVLLAWADYWATGSPDLAAAYFDTLLNNTMARYRDDTGVIGPIPVVQRMGPNGNHIVGWDPAPNASQFAQSEHQTPCNAYGLRGLQLLGQLARAMGRPSAASATERLATELEAAILGGMWDSGAGRFCDGLCAEVGHNKSVYSDMTPLFLGLVPTAARKTVWEAVAAHGLEDLGAYGAFLYLQALATWPAGVTDDGTAVLDALTKCDNTSWCAEWTLWNATMTMEAFPVDVVDLTSFAHLWGTSAISGVVEGLLGVRATSPAFATFTVQPRIGRLQEISVRVPTLHGFIEVTAKPGQLEVGVPCNTRATACVQAVAAVEEPSVNLLVDGVQVAAIATTTHLCTAEPIGCGPGGARRVITRHLVPLSR